MVSEAPPPLAAAGAGLWSCQEDLTRVKTPFLPSSLGNGTLPLVLTGDSVEFRFRGSNPRESIFTEYSDVSPGVPAAEMAQIQLGEGEDAA